MFISSFTRWVIGSVIVVIKWRPIKCPTLVLAASSSSTWMLMKLRLRLIVGMKIIFSMRYTGIIIRVWRHRVIIRVVVVS
uniref:Uncharacterized protein n=1 Tax=Lepeophtheirus salmonis TaxID=72036 RepID=A0A0K2T5U4_LEPSM